MLTNILHSYILLLLMQRSCSRREECQNKHSALSIISYHIIPCDVYCVCIEGRWHERLNGMKSI